MMNNKSIVDLTNLYGNDFYIHYTFEDNDIHSINVNTFANSLIQLSKVIKMVAAETLSNYDIEITIDRTGEGTFWSHLNIKGKNFLPK